MLEFPFTDFTHVFVDRLLASGAVNQVGDEGAKALAEALKVNEAAKLSLDGVLRVSSRFSTCVFVLDKNSRD